MFRRNYLAAVGSVGLVATAGCLGDEEEIDELESEIEDLEARETELEAQLEDVEGQRDELETERDELETRKAELEDEIEGLEAREAELENEIEELEAREADLEEERDALVAERIRNLYETAAAYHDLGADEYATAIDHANEGNWASAAKFFGLAFRSYDTTQELTYQVAAYADEENYTGVRQIATDSNAYVESMKRACERYSNAAQYYARGQTSSGDREVSAGDSHIEDAQQNEFRPLREVENAL